MILSSTDILGILGGNGVIRLSAKLSIVDGKPALSGAEGLFIYIDRFPRVDEFQATWSIYIESDGNEPDDLVLAEIQQLLPSVSIKPGLLTTVTTTDFLSENTQRPPTPRPAKAQPDLRQYEERFQSLVEDVQDQMLLVTSGRPGKDGQDGRDGADGRDGKDLVATDAELFDLKDAGQSILPMEKGQVLTWDGGKWTNLFVRQSMSAGGSAVSTGGGGTGGDTGVSSTIGWTYHPHDHTEEPNKGHFHADSSDGELVTVFHVSNETSRGNDVEVLLRDLLVQGYNRIYVALGEDLSQAHLYSVTGYTETASGFEINVTHVETAGLEPDYQNAKLYEFLFTKGAGGGGSSDVQVLNDLDDVTTDGVEDGQFLQYDSAGSEWKPVTIAPGSGIEEAPQNDNYYVRQNGQWINLEDALAALGITGGSGVIDGGDFSGGLGPNDTVSGGDFTTGEGGNSSAIFDAGDMTTGSSSATNDSTPDGGNFT